MVDHSLSLFLPYSVRCTRKVVRAVDSSFRELREHKPGTRDFDPRSALPRLDRLGPPEREKRSDARNERCASLYDAIRDMGRYEAAVEAESRKTGGDGLLPGP